MTTEPSEDEQFAYNWWGDAGTPASAVAPPQAGMSAMADATAEPPGGLTEELEASATSDNAE